MPIKFVVKIVRRLKVYFGHCSPMTLTFLQGQKCVSNLTTFSFAISLTLFNYTFKLGMRADLCMEYIYVLARFGDLDRDARSQWVSRGKDQRRIISTTKHSQGC